MNRCVIVAGADIQNYDYIRNCLKTDDFFIFCDSGLKHMDKLGVKPGLIVGDFDSHEKPDLDIETIVLPREKDDTDT
ncbi:MAG: thiamine diphosphokinase, partial [Butyrivibrio sp.]|nr:thiamine diphosphokinase [Butyrivibrio sp.]